MVDSAATTEPSLFRNRNFMLLWAAQIISALGDRIHFVVILAIIEGLFRQVDPTYKPGGQENAQLTVMLMLPFLLFGPITGMIADRFSRRKVMIVADIARILIVIIARFVFLYEEHVLSPQVLYAMILASEFFIAIFAALFSPARLAMLPTIVSPGQLLQANSMSQAAGTVASLLGFVIGGGLIAYLNIKYAMFAGAATFFLSAFFLFMMKLPPKANMPAEITHRKHPLRELREGIAYLMEHRRARQTIYLMLVFWACGGVMMTGLTGVITKHFGLRTDQYAYFMGVVGFGMILGAALCSVARNGLPKEFGIAWVMVLIALFFFLFTLQTHWLAGLIMLFLAAAFGAVLLVTLQTLLQRIVPNYIRGRVIGVSDIVTALGIIVVALPIALNPHIDEYARPILAVLAVALAIIGFALMVYYYRQQHLPLPAAIARRACSAYLSVWKKFRVGNACRIPPEGACIFVANHTTGYDPIVLQASSKRRLIQFMMAKEYYEKKPLHYLYKWLRVIPVNRTGNDTASVRSALRALKDGACLGMFPEGKISPDGNLQEGRHGVSMLALMSGCKVVPAYISGTNIHKNMLNDFLSRPGSGRQVSVYFAAPLDFSEFEGRERDDAVREEVTRRIMGAIAALRDKYETDPARRGSAT